MTPLWAEFVKNFDKSRMVKSYETATLYAPKGSATWLIIWSNLNPATGKLERIRRTFELNRIADLKERRVKAYNILAVLNEALRNGWNAFVDADLQSPKAKTVVTTMAAFNRALEVKLIGNKASSVLSFTSIAKVFRAWLVAQQLDGRPVATFNAATFQRYVSDRHSMGLSPRNINAHINLVRAVFSKMVKPLGLIPANPLLGFDMLPEVDSDLYENITGEELHRIRRYLHETDERFYLFTQFIYYAFIRPAHIGLLKRSQIDFERDLIHIAGKDTKSNRNATKQLLPALKSLLLELKVDELPGDWYLFGSKFLPSPKKLATLSTRASERWVEYVKGDLSINKLMYSLKHTGSTNYIDDNDNPDPLWLQRHMEHSSLTETMAYIANRKAKKIEGGQFR